MAKTLWEKIEARLSELMSKNPAGATPNAATEKAFADFRAEIDAAKLESTNFISAKDEEIKKLGAKITELTETITAKDGEIKTLTDAAKDASARAIEIVSSMGIDPAQIPTAPADKKAGTKAKSMKETYAELQATDPAKAGAYYLENRDKPEFWK